MKLQLKSEGKGSIIHTALKTSKQILDDALNANKNIIVEEEIIIDDDDLIIISDDEHESMAIMSSTNKSNYNLVLQDFIKSENIEDTLEVEKLSLTDAKLKDIPVIEQDDCMEITDVNVDIPLAKIEIIDDTINDNLELSFEMKDSSSSSKNVMFSEEVSEDSTISFEKVCVSLSNQKTNSESEVNNVLPKECDLNVVPLKTPFVNVPISLEKIICNSIPSTSKNFPLISKVNLMFLIITIQIII